MCENIFNPFFAIKFRRKKIRSQVRFIQSTSFQGCRHSKLSSTPNASVTFCQCSSDNCNFKFRLNSTNRRFRDMDNDWLQRVITRKTHENSENSLQNSFTIMRKSNSPSISSRKLSVNVYGYIICYIISILFIV